MRNTTANKNLNPNRIEVTIFTILQFPQVALLAERHDLVKSRISRKARMQTWNRVGLETNGWLRVRGGRSVPSSPTLCYVHYPYGLTCSVSTGKPGRRARTALQTRFATRLARIQVLAVSDQCDLDKKQNAMCIRLSWMMCCPLTMTREMPLSTGASPARCVNGLQDGRMIAFSTDGRTK